MLVLGLFSGVVAIVIVLLTVSAATGDSVAGAAVEIRLGDARE
jgi:hypothetical protein